MARVITDDVSDPGSAEKLSPQDFEASMYDRRAVHAPHVKVKGEWKIYSPPHRDWSEVTGICLHQTACWMGERIERYDHLGAHFAVTREQRVLRMCDENRVVYHGNGWNARCVGIEIDGLYSGVEGDPRTVWDNPATPAHERGMPQVPAQHAVTRQLCRWIVANVAAHGGRVGFLVAHRQSSSQRRDDPGSGLWRGVALPLHAELGLSDGGVGFRIGDGYAIPESWDPRCEGIRY